MRNNTDNEELRPRPDGREWLCCPGSMTKEQARARFEERFGEPPQVIVREKLGWWWCGPIPTKVEA